MLEISNLSVSFGAIKAVKGFSGRASTGHITGILGANGAGKSSLLRAISGLNASTGGTIKLDGRDITKLSASERAKIGIAHAMEGRRLFRHLTVAENLRLAWSFGARKTSLSDAFDDAFNRFPILAEKSRIHAGLLSGGQQQMMILSCATMRAPRVLLLDEPSLGLSPLITTQIYRFIGEFSKSAEVCVVLTEQIAAIALKVATDVHVLRQGATVYTGDAKKMVSEGRTSELSSMYLG
jgi:branched-chain amino acid transport system ATP-binding protein